MHMAHIETDLFLSPIKTSDFLDDLFEYGFKVTLYNMDDNSFCVAVKVGEPENVFVLGQYFGGLPLRIWVRDGLVVFPDYIVGKEEYELILGKNK